jgi:hypothetical protein
MPIVERGSKGLTAREYGSGYYGTVLPTHTKGTVLKITSDPTEAKFAYAAKRLRHYPAGIVKYGPVFELGGSHDGRPIFALWREEAYDVGDAVSGRSEDSLNDIIDYADKAFKLLGTRDQRTQNLQAKPAQLQAHIEEMSQSYEKPAEVDNLVRRARQIRASTQPGFNPVAARESRDASSIRPAARCSSARPAKPIAAPRANCSGSDSIRTSKPGSVRAGRSRSATSRKASIPVTRLSQPGLGSSNSRRLPNGSST